MNVSQRWSDRGKTYLPPTDQLRILTTTEPNSQMPRVPRQTCNPARLFRELDAVAKGGGFREVRHGDYAPPPTASEDIYAHKILHRAVRSPRRHGLGGPEGTSSSRATEAGILTQRASPPQGILAILGSAEVKKTNLAGALKSILSGSQAFAITVAFATPDE